MLRERDFDSRFWRGRGQWPESGGEGMAEDPPRKAHAGIYLHPRAMALEVTRVGFTSRCIGAKSHSRAYVNCLTLLRGKLSPNISSHSNN